MKNRNSYISRVSVCQAGLVFGGPILVGPDDSGSDHMYASPNDNFHYSYEGRSVNSANGFLTLFRDMLGKLTMHVSKELHFAFKMAPNTIQNNIFLVQLQHPLLGPNHNRYKNTINLCKSIVYCCI